MATARAGQRRLCGKREQYQYTEHRPMRDQLALLMPKMQPHILQHTAISADCRSDSISLDYHSEEQLDPIILSGGQPMFPRYAFFNLGAIIVLWGLTVIGAVASLPSWIATEPEHEEGVRTIGGRRLAWSRVSLTAGCVAVWVCTFLGCVVKGPKSPFLDFGFWQDYPVALQTFFFQSTPPLSPRYFSQQKLEAEAG